MNIFILDTDTKKCAQYHNDKYVVKMILESVQMLMSAYHLTENKEALSHPDMYKLTHKNHPCTIWVNESIQNWEWLMSLMCELNSEYKLRYKKIRVNHLAFDKLEKIVLKCGKPKLPNIGLTPFAQAMPEELRNDDPVKAYRDYYMRDKRELAVWSNRQGVPNWFRLSSV